MTAVIIIMEGEAAEETQIILIWFTRVLIVFQRDDSSVFHQVMG